MQTQRMVTDFGRIKSAELNSRAIRGSASTKSKVVPEFVGVRLQNRAHGQRGSASTKSGARLWWGQERRAEPTGKFG